MRRASIFLLLAVLGIVDKSKAFTSTRNCNANRRANLARSAFATESLRHIDATRGVLGLRAAINDFDSPSLFQAFSSLADAASDVSNASNSGGVIGFLVTLTENSIVGLHDFLRGFGIENSYGLSIILFTLFIKVITFPLTYQQLSSTTKMQTLQPKVQDIQKRYGNDPETANRMIAELYREEKVNPLSGCLPSLAQIPIFISLYRALLNLAKEDKLTEPFLWIPNLEGPVFQAPPTESLNWLKNWVDGAPSLGWHDTLCYLTIPVILVVTQSVSQQLMSPPKKPGSEGDTSQAILKYLPLMIGYFSLNVPSGLGVYWIINNFISTLTSVLIRNQLGMSVLPSSMGSTSSTFDSGSPKSIIVDAEIVDEPERKGFAPQTTSEIEGDDEAVSESLKPKKSGKKKRRKGGN